MHNEKAKVFQAMRPLKPDDLVRGQYAGYRKEPGVAKDSDVETFCALRLFIDSWRWEGVPWYLRSGKYLAETATEVLVELKPPPQRLFADSAPATGRANYLRFRLSPNSAIALAARVKRAGKEFVGDQRELYLVEEQPGEEAPYERLLGDAMAGDGALFTREDAVEAAWAVVDPVLKTHHRAQPLQARQLGAERGGRAHCGGRRLAQSMAGCAGGQGGRQKESVHCRYRRDRLDQRECISRYDSHSAPATAPAGIYDAKNKKESIMSATRTILARVPRNSLHTLRILAIDIGGSHLKAALVDARGRMLTKKMTVKTPKVCPPNVMVDTSGGARQAASVPQSDCDWVSRRRARRPCVDSAPLGHEGMG